MTFWYKKNWLNYLLLPLSWCYQSIMSIRRWCYQTRWFKSYRSPAPVIVVGNLTVGGTGKTPVVIELAKQLTNLGYKPGIVSRGYGGKAPEYPFLVSNNADVNFSGDEPKLIAKRTNCPVVVDPKRPRAAQFLLNNFSCDIVLSDDGLQHYAMDRDVEIVVQDSQRGNGNSFCLPAGPLREPIKRLASVDYVLTKLQPNVDTVYQLNNPEKTLELKDFSKVHAVAGIGNPNKFFNLLRDNGVEVIEHPFPDHHRFRAKDLAFNDDLPIIITEKDAVKCDAISAPNCWVLAISVTLPEKLYLGLHKQLQKHRAIN